MDYEWLGNFDVAGEKASQWLHQFSVAAFGFAFRVEFSWVVHKYRHQMVMVMVMVMVLLRTSILLALS
jgi:hypothetical protein